MEPGEGSSSPWNPPSLTTVPEDPLSPSPRDPELPPTLLGSTLQGCCSPVAGGGRTDRGGPWDGHGEAREEDSSSGTGPGGAAQRSPRPSAFPSSLAWDSDSEKETQDEEELQHFSNPHGLAAHSPGSPDSGHRRDRAGGEGDIAPEKLQHFSPEAPPPPGDGRSQGGASTQRDEPKTAQPSSEHSEDQGDGRLSERGSPEPLLTEDKPKEGRGGRGGSEEGPALDVYSFPGDSDPESPPLAPWAHCTFTQRRKRKRALLKPFSGPGTWARPEGGPSGARVRAPQEVGARDRARAPQEVGPRDRALQEVGATVLEFTEQEGSDGVERELEEAVFTCVECSIYFKRQVHLQEHMLQHWQGRGGEGTGRGRDGGVAGGGFRCAECGWELEDGEALAGHQRQHRESREKILEEIGKLSEDGAGPGAGPGEHAKTHVREHNGHRTARGSSSSCSAPPPAPPCDPCDLCGFQASGTPALREHLILAHLSRDEGLEEDEEDEEEEEGCPGTSRDLLDPSRPSLRGRGAAFSPPAPRGPRRREVAFKSIGNKRARRGARGGVAVAVAVALPPETALARDRVARQNPRRNPAPADSKEALQLKRSFSDGLRGASESLGLTEGQQTQLRHMLPLVLVEPLSPRSAPTSAPGLRGRVRAPADSPRFVEDDCPVVEEDDDDDEEEEDEEHDDDDDDEGMLGDEMGLLKNVERKCPYCPDRFHNGIGLANHVRGHLNRVGVSYNVRHFISPEEVNAIERKFSYQKKRKKVANFDPDTFSLMRCEFCSAGFDTRAGLSSHARAHLRDFGITNWEVTVSPINILRELFSSRPDLVLPTAPPSGPPLDPDSEEEEEEEELERGGARGGAGSSSSPPESPQPQGE